jgi:hypothetical protein
MTAFESTPSTSKSLAKVVVSENPEGDSAIQDDNTIYLIYRAGTGRSCGAFVPWATEKGAKDFAKTPSQCAIDAITAAENRLQVLEDKLGARHEPEDEGNGDWPTRFDKLLAKAEEYTQEEVTEHISTEGGDGWAVKFQPDLAYPHKHGLLEIPENTIYGLPSRIALPFDVDDPE